ncbi:restriction endonuclease subunit S [Mycoplasma sp. 1654_15]|uniref:restriction endonuclease subunit S n=1 Tax=Mycoplasma sp. 1654_15 TaxID=2725994 RepID=UPI001449F5C6|nr:restriction endonuclease subunit S [Mycoplasma sp. 1654_15]QJB71238.1 restriction endonuclease subunit S [Mycoplasma sp. 1654_15]
MLIFKIYKNIIYKFIYFYLYSNQNKIYSLVNYNAFPYSISKDELNNFSLYIPCTQEQQKIASLFYTLDKIVSLYERKISLFEKLEKAFLTNMFVKENEGKSNVRFKNFTDNWVEAKVEDMFEIKRGRNITKKELEQNQGKYPVYSSQTSGDGILGKINTFDFEGYHLIWTTHGANAGTVFLKGDKFSTTNNCFLLAIQNNNKFSYMFYLLSLSLMPKNYINSHGAIPHFTYQGIQELILKVPCLKEQQKIGDLFLKVKNTHAQLKRKQKSLKNGLFSLKFSTFWRKNHIFLHKHLI